MALLDSDRDALTEILAPRMEAVVDRTVQRVKSTIPGYDSISTDDLRDGIIADLGRALLALLEQRPLSAVDRAGMSEIGDARAAAGVPLESMLQVYRCTIDEMFAELWKASAQEAIISPEAALRITQSIWRYADPMMDMAVQAYREREIERVVAESHRRTAGVLRLLIDPTGAGSHGTSVASLVDPNARYLAFRARSTDGALDLLSSFELAGALSDGAAAPFQGDVIGYARARPSVASSLPAIIGIGPRGTPDQLAHSLAVATRVVETAAAFGRPGMHSLHDLAFEAIARTETTITAHLIDRFVAPCEPSTTAGAELLETVAALLDHGMNAERTAGVLFVHPNTVRNRMRRFEQVTGSDLHAADDLGGLRLALLARQLGETSPPGGVPPVAGV